MQKQTEMSWCKFRRLFCCPFLTAKKYITCIPNMFVYYLLEGFSYRPLWGFFCAGKILIYTNVLFIFSCLKKIQLWILSDTRPLRNTGTYWFACTLRSVFPSHDSSARPRTVPCSAGTRNSAGQNDRGAGNRPELRKTTWLGLPVQPLQISKG